MTSSSSSSHPQLPFPSALTPPSRYLTSPTPPLFDMPPNKASLSSSNSPAARRRSLHASMTPQKPLTTKEISPPLQHKQGPRFATRYAPSRRQTDRSQTQSLRVNVSSSPREAQSDVRSSSENVSSHSSGIPAQVELEMSDDDNEDDDFMRLLTEVKEIFTNTVPDFVINDKGIRTRQVRIANNEVAELVFEDWDERSGKGFWTLDLGNGQKYIVKYFNRGQHYRAWLWPGARYDENPIAWQRGSSPKKDSKSTSTTGAKAGKRNASTVASENLDASEDDATPFRALRQRSYQQMMPYTTEKLDHKRALSGKPRGSTNVDYDVLPPQKPAGQKVASVPPSAKRRRASSKSDSRTLTPFSTLQDFTPEMVTDQTRLNTRLTATLTDVPEVVYLEDVPNIEALFDEIAQAWHSKILGNAKVKLAVKFPWLDDNDTNSTLSVRRDRPRSFDRLLEMINRAPCWEDGGNAECVVNVHVIVE